MDEHIVDQNLQNRFQDYEDLDFDPENWEILEKSLDQNTGNNKVGVSSSLLVRMAFVALFVSNLVLLYLYNVQSAELEKIKGASSSKLSESITSLDSTIKPSSGEASNLVLPKSKIKDSIPNLVLARNLDESFFPPTTLAKEIDLISNKATSNKSLGIQLPHKVNKVRLFFPRPMNITINQRRTFDLLNNRSEANIAKSPTSISKLRPGITLGLPRTKSDIADFEPGFSLGVDLEYSIRKSLIFYTGVSYAQLSYKIDDHGHPEDLRDLLETYPAISEDQSIQSLHEVFQDALVIEVPLGLRFDLGEKMSQSSFVGVNAYARIFLKQDFEYEYSTSDSRFIINTAINQAKISPGGISIHFGKRFEIGKRSWGEVQLFYSKDLFKQGIEKRQFMQYGVKGAIRLASFNP